MSFLVRLPREPLCQFFLIGGATFSVYAAGAPPRHSPAEIVDVETERLQPFLSFTTGSATTCDVSAEPTYDWNSRHRAVPIVAAVAQLMRCGDQPVQLGATARYRADSPASGPQG
jgi:hypothetical protein